MHEYDKSGKWLIQHHRDSILRLAGVEGIESWRPLQAEVVQPRQLPDGVIETLLRGKTEPDFFVVEIATYPDARLDEQVMRDAALVYLDRRVVPDVVTLVLRPKGNLQVAGVLELASPNAMTRWTLRWKVVTLWTVLAETLLNAQDVGLVPWIPLTRFDGPPEPVFERCRERIDREAPPQERENLLAVTHVLAGLRYNDTRLFQLLGGRNSMIESPVLQELRAEWTQEGARDATQRSIIRVLTARFGRADPDIADRLKMVSDEARLEALTDAAALS